MTCVGSTQQNSQSVPGRIFGIVFLGHCVVPLQPFVRGKTCKLREQFTVHFVPIFSQLSYRGQLCPRLVRTGDEDRIEFRPGLHKGWTGIEKEAYYNDIPQIISAGGNQFLATRGGESQQNIFKSHRRRALERGRTWEESSHLSMGTPHCHSRRHVPDSRSRRATAP